MNNHQETGKKQLGEKTGFGETGKGHKQKLRSNNAIDPKNQIGKKDKLLLVKRKEWQWKGSVKFFQSPLAPEGRPGQHQRGNLCMRQMLTSAAPAP